MFCKSFVSQTCFFWPSYKLKASPGCRITQRIDRMVAVSKTEFITVKPLIMDTLKSGRPPTTDKLFTLCLYIAHIFLPPKKGQPLNNGQNARPQRVHYSEVPLYTDHLEDHNAVRDGPRYWVYLIGVHDVKISTNQVPLQKSQTTNFFTFSLFHYIYEISLHVHTKQLLYS